MKQWIKRKARRFGAHLYTDGSLPTGVDWLHDVMRLDLLPKTPVCFDVGANIGQTVLELKERLPDCCIHSFEPFPSVYSELRETCRGLQGVTPVALGLGSEPATLLVQPRDMSVWSSLAPTDHMPSSRPAEEVRVETIDRYCVQASIDRIDLLKIDTEGFELNVLRGARGMLESQRVGFVYVEVTFDQQDTQHTRFEPVLELLAAQGFRFLGLYETYALHHFGPQSLFCNALFVSSREWQARHGVQARAGR
jgi:FkbM family methyltransferase